MKSFTRDALKLGWPDASFRSYGDEVQTQDQMHRLSPYGITHHGSIERDTSPIEAFEIIICYDARIDLWTI